jgi:hypothetical protein
MSAPLAVQLCRVISPERLSDRLLSSGVFTLSEERSLGDQVILAYLFEVIQPWLPSSQLLPSLQATLAEELPKLHDHNGQGDLADRFELLLRGVNQTLNSVSEAGETDWIGNLSGLIMVMSGEELHFAQTGRCHAYLLQNNRIRQITDDHSETPQDPHPLKTFANLATGTLKEGDQLIVGNHELYREVSLDALRRMLNTASPYQALQGIARELKREKNPAVQALVFRFGFPATNEPEEVILEEEMQSGFKKFSRRVLPLLDRAKTAGSKAGAVAATAATSAAGKTQEVWVNKVAPKASELVEKGKQKLAKEEAPAEEAIEDTGPVVEIIASKKQREKQHLQAIAEAAEARVHQEPEEEDDFISVVPDSERTLETDHAPDIKVAKKAKDTALSVLAKITTTLRVALNHALSWLAIPGNKKRAALGSGVLILVLSVWIGISAARQQQVPTTDGSTLTLLREATDLKTKLDTAVNDNQQIEAARLIFEATAKLQALSSPTANQKHEADNLWKAITAHADTLGKTMRFTAPAATYEFQTEVRGMIAGLPYFYGWNTSDHILDRTGRGNAADVQLQTPLSSSSDVIVSITRSSESDTVGYILTKQGKVHRISQVGTRTMLREINPSEGEFAVGDAVGSYAGHVYILDGKVGLLWRYTNTGTQYSRGVSMIDVNKFDIKRSVSFAIDGSVYFLRSNGEVLKFHGGRQETGFSLTDLPPVAEKFIQPLQIITNETFPSIYVLDAGATSSPWSSARILEFTKNGTFVRQFAFPPEFTKIRAFDINPKEKKLWVLNDKTVAEFDIQ